MRNLDFSSWQALLSTLVGLAVVSLIMVGIRLLLMQTVQHKRERDNRQINERLRTLIAAYKTLGGSFTGNLAVDPTHLRDLQHREEDADSQKARISSDRSRRMRDAVEAALSDIILLGTEEQVTLAANAAMELTAGRPVHTAELVVSLRNFIREVLDLEPVPQHLSIPRQGPLRPSASRGKGEGGSKEEGKRSAGGMGGGGMGGGGMGGGAGAHGDPFADDEHHR
ncbi:hypothetical protein EKH79_03985 [Dyella dinghuensis]|uniref:Uncharacterized protein n=1 Tax=Dyella dinghuensis TaxID=1920169 RepID=A0A432LVI7_9GAMM|nr:hypothetical protein [Dyella dinghuensis]RUL65877.1 hypothetical protein EKH79_03985 [Dyella dinghuensis]